MFVGVTCRIDGGGLGHGDRSVGGLCGGGRGFGGGGGCCDGIGVMGAKYDNSDFGGHYGIVMSHRRVLVGGAHYCRCVVVVLWLYNSCSCGCILVVVLWLYNSCAVVV